MVEVGVTRILRKVWIIIVQCAICTFVENSGSNLSLAGLETQSTESPAQNHSKVKKYCQKKTVKTVHIRHSSYHLLQLCNFAERQNISFKFETSFEIFNSLRHFTISTLVKPKVGYIMHCSFALEASSDRVLLLISFCVYQIWKNSQICWMQIYR